MFDPSVKNLFPLPLSTFEKYMLWDDRPDYPMDFVIQMKLSGELDRAVFELSLNEALSRNPLLCAIVKSSGRRGPVWMLAEESRPTIDWDVLGAAIGNPGGERIDLSSEVGLRVWVRQSDGIAEVMLQFHHACCDGIGAIRFIGHVLAKYGMYTASPDRKPKLHFCDPAGLIKRGDFSSETPVQGNRIRSLWASFGDCARWICRRPEILCPSDRTKIDGPAPLSYLEMYRHTFDETETRKINLAGSRQGATVNDLLLRDMLLTLNEWSEPESYASKRWFRIAVPVNLKTGEADRISAANGVSYTFVTRSRRQCADSKKLLEGIHRETDASTRRRRAMMFLRGFRLMERIPGAIRLYMRSNRCLATVVLSNLGDIGRHFGAEFPCEAGKIVAGNVVLEEIFGAPPVRPNTRASFMIGRYGERFFVSVRCDPLIFNTIDSHRLLDLYVDRIKRTINEG